MNEDKKISLLFEKYCANVKKINDSMGVFGVFFKGYNVETVECLPYIEKIFISHRAQICYSHLISNYVAKKYYYDMFSDEFLDDLCSLIRIQEIKECMKDTKKRLPYKYFYWLRKIQETTGSSLTYFSMTTMISRLSEYFVDNEQQLNILFVNVEKTLKDLNLLVEYNRNTTSTFYMFDNIIRSFLTKLNNMEVEILNTKSRLDLVENFEKKVIFEECEDFKEETKIEPTVKTEEKRKYGSANNKNFGGINMNIRPENIFVKNKDKKIKTEGDKILDDVYIKGTEKIIREKKEMERKVCNKCIEYKKHITGLNRSVQSDRYIVNDLRKQISELNEAYLDKSREIIKILEELNALKEKIKTEDDIIAVYEKCSTVLIKYSKEKKMYKLLIKETKNKINEIQEFLKKKEEKIKLSVDDIDVFINDVKLERLKFICLPRLKKKTEKEYKICFGFERLLQRYNNKNDYECSILFKEERLIDNIDLKSQRNLRVMGVHHIEYTIPFLKKLLPLTPMEKIIDYSKVLNKLDVRYTKMLTRCESYSLIKYLFSTGLKRKCIWWLYCLLSGMNNDGVKKVKNQNDMLFYKQIAPEYKYNYDEIKKMKVEFDKLTENEIRLKYKNAFIKLDRLCSTSTTLFNCASKKYNKELSEKAIKMLRKYDVHFDYDENEKLYKRKFSDKFDTCVNALEDYWHGIVIDNYNPYTSWFEKETLDEESYNIFSHTELAMLKELLTKTEQYEIGIGSDEERIKQLKEIIINYFELKKNKKLTFNEDTIASDELENTKFKTVDMGIIDSFKNIDITEENINVSNNYEDVFLKNKK